MNVFYGNKRVLDIYNNNFYVNLEDYFPSQTQTNDGIITLLSKIDDSMIRIHSHKIMYYEKQDIPRDLECLTF